MPFDDSDIKKMIEAQISKGGLRLGSEGSAEVQDLILRMLQPEVTQRWPIELVQKHSWFGRAVVPEKQKSSSTSYVGHALQKQQGPPVYAS